jgi:hypothetical protein
MYPSALPLCPGRDAMRAAREHACEREKVKYDSQGQAVERQRIKETKKRKENEKGIQSLPRRRPLVNCSVSLVSMAAVLARVAILL